MIPFLFMAIGMLTMETIELCHGIWLCVRRYRAGNAPDPVLMATQGHTRQLRDG